MEWRLCQILLCLLKIFGYANINKVAILHTAINFTRWIILFEIILFKRKFWRKGMLQKGCSIQQIHATIDKAGCIKLFFLKRSNSTLLINGNSAITIKVG